MIGCARSDRARLALPAGSNFEILVKSEEPEEKKTRYGPDGDYSHIGMGTQSEIAPFVR
jgi:hypothetical protein